MSPSRFDAGALLRERHKAKASPDIRPPLLARLFGVALAALREIFDESAYERFLVRRGLQPSAESYADFCAEHEKARTRRPRCC